jgi:hypothetical protein
LKRPRRRDGAGTAYSNQLDQSAPLPVDVSGLFCFPNSRFDFHVKPSLDMPAYFARLLGFIP